MNMKEINIQEDEARIKTAQLYALTGQAKSYDDRIELGRGDPDFDTPKPILEKAEEFFSKPMPGEIPVEGILPLREAIAERVERFNGIKVNPETEIVVTNGGQEALFIMVQAAIHENDEILVPDPNYNTYRDAINFAGGYRIGVPTKREESFRVDPNMMEAAVTPRTRAMVLVSPNNPSGAVISPEDQKELVDIAVRHDFKILSDEIYDRFIYDDLPHVSPATLPGGRERTVTLNAVSKMYSMCGWRIGWLVGDAGLIEPIKQIKAAINGGTSLISQQGALAALSIEDSVILEMKAAYEKRRKIVITGLDRINIPYGTPQGGQFVFADIGRLPMKSLEFCEWVLDKCHVLVYPGGGYGPAFDDYFRITFLQPEEKLEEAMNRMERLFKDEGLC